MALRLIELILPGGNEELIAQMVEDMDIEELWHLRMSDDRVMSRILISSEESEALLDALEKRFSNVDGFRVIVHSIVAALPSKEEEEEEAAKDEEDESEIKRKIGRIYRGELQSGLADTAKLTKVYMVTVSLSVIVAAVGLAKDNVAVIIGAMVIAPLLGPNMALSLATTLADISLAKVALKTLMAGILLAILLSLVLGYVLEVDPTTPEIASRTRVGLGDIGIALASGAAGALFLTIGFSTALVGVMLAVALLPPLVTIGLLIGAGSMDLALDALLLLLTNLICINLAGVSTFVAQGVRPLAWWDADKAKKMTVLALIIWGSLLGVLMMLIFIWGGLEL